MLPIQNGLICWLDASDGKAGETLLKDRTSYGHNLVLKNFQQGYGFTGNSIKVKESDGSSSNIYNALYINNGGFKIPCKSFCLCIEQTVDAKLWYIFDGRGLDGNGFGTNYCYSNGCGSSYDISKTRTNGLLTPFPIIKINQKIYLYFELVTAQSFTMSILGRYTKNEHMGGKFYSLYAYNRALTEQEILHNMEYENNKINYVNNNNLPKIVQKLSDASNIKITGNKYGNRVQTVIDKIVEKADNVTKAINQEVVNNTHSFKVGKGNNVDVSTDVQDSFSEIAMKGQTYQNLFVNCTNSKCLNNYQHWKVVGENTFEVNADGTNKFLFIKKENMLLKPSTQYTFIFEVLNNTLVSSSDSAYSFTIFGSSGSFKGGVILTGDKLKTTTFLKTTIPDLSTATHGFDSYINNNAVSGNLKVRLTVLEGDHTNNPNLPSYFEGIVGIGDESKNLLMNSNKIVGENSTTEFVQFADIAPIFDKYGLIPYTISFDIKSKDTSKKNIVQVYGQNGAGARHSFASYVNVTTDWQRKYVTVTPTLANSSIAATMLAFYGEYNTGNIPIIKNVKIEKCKTVTQYTPYDDGYKIETLSNNKNLIGFNGITESKITGNGITVTIADNEITVNGTSTSDTWFNLLPVFNKTTNHNYSQTFYKVMKDTPLVLTPTIISGNLGTNQKITFHLWTSDDAATSKYNISGDIGRSSQKTIVKGIEYRRFWIYIAKNVVANNFKFKFQLEENTKTTDYESHKQDKIQLLLDQPLMELPNGVYDEITKDGKLIRRIGKVVLNGSENWYVAGALDQTKKYFTVNNLINNAKQTINSKFDDQISNTLLINNPYTYPTKSCIWALWQDPSSRIRISISNIQDIDGIKAWLKENPTTLYYELQNPIIKDLSNNQIKLFKDGHLTFNTVVAPESTHIVQLNKSAQIQNTIKQSQLLDNKIAVLENNYDSLMLSTMSTLNDLELDYTLK